MKRRRQQQVQVLEPAVVDRRPPIDLCARRGQQGTEGLKVGGRRRSVSVDDLAEGAVALRFGRRQRVVTKQVTEVVLRGVHQAPEVLSAEVVALVQAGVGGQPQGREAAEVAGDRGRRLGRRWHGRRSHRDRFHGGGRRRIVRIERVEAIKAVQAVVVHAHVEVLRRRSQLAITQIERAQVEVRVVVGGGGFDDRRVPDRGGASGHALAEPLHALARLVMVWAELQHLAEVRHGDLRRAALDHAREAHQRRDRFVSAAERERELLAVRERALMLRAERQGLVGAGDRVLDERVLEQQLNVEQVPIELRLGRERLDRRRDREPLHALRARDPLREQEARVHLLGHSGRRAPRAGRRQRLNVRRIEREQAAVRVKAPHCVPDLFVNPRDLAMHGHGLRRLTERRERARQQLKGLDVGRRRLEDQLKSRERPLRVSLAQVRARQPTQGVEIVRRQVDHPLRDLNEVVEAVPRIEQVEHESELTTGGVEITDPRVPLGEPDTRRHVVWQQLADARQHV